MMNRPILFLSTAVVLCAVTSGASAQDRAPDPVTLGFNSYGLPGLIDMPSAQVLPDAELAVTTSFGAGTNRNTIAFQILPWATGAFRYSAVEDVATGEPRLYDRSFDAKFQILRETDGMPAVALGFQDFIGTGFYSAEYLVASKTVHPDVVVTGGIGWGRLGSYNGLGTVLGDRPTGRAQTGGQVESAKWFQGEAALFGGVSWQASDRLRLSVEYSSDAYENEVREGTFNRTSPINLGLSYRLGRSSQISAYTLHGSEMGFAFSTTLNPKRPPGGAGSNEGAPVPVGVRGPVGVRTTAADLGWTTQPGQRDSLQNTLSQVLEAEGFVLEGLSLTGTRAYVRLRNTVFDSTAQAIGRVARILSQTMPASVETFVIVPVIQGMGISEVTIRRSDLEALEYAPDHAWEVFARTQVTDAATPPADLVAQTGLYPSFDWKLAPYAAFALFDPDAPLRGDVGLELAARFEAAPGLVFAGAYRKKLAGNRDSSDRVSDSVLQRVRSDANLYDKGDPALEYLTASYFTRPGENLYGRVSAGYLERMYGGVSGELLWKPVDSRLALGVEINAVKQRDFDLAFGFQDYETVTGHVSAYYAFGNGFHGQLDVGRYLAEDWGATVTLDREFANGWKVGAYATFTDVSADDFGEGSFDKGLRLTIPLSWQLGSPNRRKIRTQIQPLSRDGGARLQVPDRLYDLTRDYHEPGLRQQWGRFWR